MTAVLTGWGIWTWVWGQEPCEGRRLCEEGGRGWSDNNQKSGERHGTIVSSVSRRDGLNYSGRTNSCCFKLPCLRSFVIATVQNEYNFKWLHDLAVTTFLAVENSATEASSSSFFASGSSLPCCFRLQALWLGLLPRVPLLFVLAWLSLPCA